MIPSNDDTTTGFSDAGSYDFDRFSPEELGRLEQQAVIASHLEGPLLEKAGLKPGMETLDLACGPGIVSTLMAKKVSPAPVLGVDLNENLLNIAKGWAQRSEADNVRFQQGNVYELQLEENRFDFVYARFLFQHLHDPQKALANIRRVLKPGGILCIADVDDQWLTFYPEPDCFQDFVSAAAAGQQAQGGDRYVGRKLGYYLREAGFTDVSVSTPAFSSQDFGMEAFLNLTSSFKKHHIPKEHQERITQAFGELAKSPNAWGYIGIFIAVGRCPG